MSRPDMEAMAADVVLLVKTAIGPLLEHIAVSDVRIATLEGLLGKDVSRVEGYTAYLQRDLSALSERVAVVEVRSPAPTQISDLAPVLARLDVLEATPPARDGLPGVPGEKGLDGASGPAGPPGDRGLEGPAGTPGRDGDRGPAGDNGLDGLIGPPGDRGQEGPAGPVRDGRDGLPGVPGVPGEKGLDGVSGQHGKDGSDGLGFDDLAVEFDGERALALTFIKGDQRKSFQVTLPCLIYRGIFTEGKTYQAGDVVTYGGNSWYARKEATVKPDYIGLGPQPKDFWTLMVKRGSDGKAGGPGVDGKPGRDLTEKSAWPR